MQMISIRWKVEILMAIKNPVALLRRVGILVLVSGQLQDLTTQINYHIIFAVSIGQDALQLCPKLLLCIVK